MTTVFFSAGDVSGDRHAAQLARVLAERHPDWRLLGLGGAELDAAGVECVADQADLAVGGLLEVVGSAPRVARAWRATFAALRASEPDLVVLVDSGGFNIPLARRVRRLGAARILYYVAPQVWAWRAWRVRKLARRVDRMAVIFPFEPEVYADTGLRVDFVGHPLVDAMDRLRARSDATAARDGLSLPQGARIVALLPGSRRNEIDHQLPVQLAAAARLHGLAPGTRFVLALTDAKAAERARALVAAASLPPSLPLDVVTARTHEVMLASDVALAKPGTVTVELMLLGRPMVVMGRAHPLTAAVVRRALKVPWLAMPNLVAGEAVVPELMQEEATPDALAQALYALLEGPERDAQLARLARARARLGSGGAAAAAAGIVEEMVGLA